MELDKTTYLTLLRADSEALFAAAELGLEPPVSACPGWTVGALVGHIGSVYTAWNKRVRERDQDTADILPEDFAGLPGFYEWAGRDFVSSAMPPGLLAWAKAQADALQSTLAKVAPDERVGTWYPPQQTAAFVQRRMPLETAVHRWDAQHAHGKEQPIDPELARDGIDEVLDIMVPMFRRREKLPEGTGERYHLHRTDGDGEWLVEFAADGIRVTREHAKGDVAIRGTASDLLLWLWGRVHADRLEVKGDAAYVDRWFEMAPTG